MMPTVDEIFLLARHAGLDLEQKYLEELVSAYGYVRAMVDRLPKARPRGDEPAHSFVPTRFLPEQR
jgi:hypothetical protein